MEGENDLEILASLLDGCDEGDFLDDCEVELGSNEDKISQNLCTSTITASQNEATNSSSLCYAADEDRKSDQDESFDEMKEKMKRMEEQIKLLQQSLAATKDPSNNTNRASTEVECNKYRSTASLTVSKLQKADSGCNPSVQSNCSPSVSDHLGSGKKRIAHTPKQPTVAREKISAKRKADDIIGPANKVSKLDAADRNCATETFSGLRIISPLVSAAVMEKRMEGRKFVKISQIQNKTSKNDDIEGDWVTMGVIVNKMPPRKSANGNTYGIWKLSDLGASTASQTVALFLFGEVYKQHWKTTEGTLVALLNPSIMPSREKFSQSVAINLDNPKKMMVVGTAKDYGHCKGLKKSDGQPCNSVINRSYGEYCEFHVQAAYKKIKSKRMECQSGYGAPAKPPQLRQKLEKSMNSSGYMYQGKIFTTGPSVKDKKKKNVSMGNLHLNLPGAKDLIQATKEEIRQKREEVKQQKALEGPSEQFLELISMPTAGSMNLVKHLKSDEEKKQAPEKRRQPASASELLKAHHNEVKKPKVTRMSIRSKTPVIGQGLTPGDDVLLFGDTPNSKLVSSRRDKDRSADRAKLRALSVIQTKGPLPKDNPNEVRKKPSPKSIENVKKRVSDSLEQDEDEGQMHKKSVSRILGEEFGHIDLKSEEGKKLIAAKSAHVGEVKAAEAERQEKYFNELERKENMEEKMKAITEMTVKVVCCKQCDYIAESASNRCYKEKHKLKYSKTIKRFFFCKDCKQRTVAYAVPVPKHRCRNCGSKDYERTSMWTEKQGPKIGRETLLLRGEERKFINS